MTSPVSTASLLEFNDHQLFDEMRAAPNPTLSCSCCRFASPKCVPSAIPNPRFRLGASTPPPRSVSVSTPAASAAAAEEPSSPTTATTRRRLILLRHAESVWGGRFTRGALLYLKHP